MRGFFGSGILSTRVDQRDFLGLSRHFVTPKQSTYVHMILSHSSSYRCYALFMWRNMEKLLGCASRLRLLRISQILAQSYMYCIVIIYICYYSHGKIHQNSLFCQHDRWVHGHCPRASGGLSWAVSGSAQVERDSWDEQRLRALCAKHGWAGCPGFQGFSMAFPMAFPMGFPPKFSDSAT